MISRKTAPRLLLLLLGICVVKTVLVSSLDDGASGSSNPCQDQQGDFYCGATDGEPLCISDYRICDNVKDCPDGKDEENCDYLHECPEGDFTCKDGLACISPSFRCNGQFECSDGSDELGCESLSSSPPSPLRMECLLPKNFFCELDNKCIPSSARCDGKSDCDSMEDEKNCPPNICLEKGSFKCGDVCLHYYQVCNGVEECADGSDERDCGNHLPNADEFLSTDYLFCKDSEFQCSNGRCIAGNKVCDGAWDCSTGEDEGGLCGQCENYGCGSACKDFPSGPKCSCPSDMMLSVDEKTCRAPNFCEVDGQQCAHHCQQDGSTVQCICSEGYDLDGDGFGCVLKEEHHNGTLFFVNDGKSVRKTNLFKENGSVVYEEFVPAMPDSVKHISSMAFNQKEQRLYLVAVGSRARYSDIFFTDGESGAESLLQGRGLKHVAFDWVGDNLYYASNGLGIGVCSSDGRYCSHLITGRKYVPGEIILDYGDLIVHPKRGLLIWLDYSKDHPNGAVVAAGMDGSKPRFLHRGSTARLAAIAIDYATERLHIVDVEQQLLILDLNTLQRKSSSLKDAPSSMLYFDSSHFYVSKINKFMTRLKGGNEVESMHKLRGEQFPLAINNSVYNEPLSNPCANLHCSHLCVLTEASGSAPLMAKCICPDKYSMADNGSCIFNRQLDGPMKTSGKYMEHLCAEDESLACFNEGRCSEYYGDHGDITPACNCPNGFTGLYCELASAGFMVSGADEDSGLMSGWVALLFFFFIVLPLAGLLAFCSVKRYPDLGHRIANLLHSLSERFNSGQQANEGETRHGSPLLKNDVEVARGGDATMVNIPHNYDNPGFQRINEEWIEQDIQSSFPLPNRSPSSSPTF